MGDAFKGATTDALNKIASYLGIGIDVYRGKQSHAPSNYSKPSAPAPAPMQPSSSFDDTADRKAKALSALQKAKKVSTVKGLIAEQKAFKSTPEGTSFQSGATLDDVVKNNSIELVGEFYKFVK